MTFDLNFSYRHCIRIIHLNVNYNLYVYQWSGLVIICLTFQMSFITFDQPISGYFRVCSTSLPILFIEFDYNLNITVFRIKIISTCFILKQMMYSMKMVEIPKKTAHLALQCIPSNFIIATL